MSRYKCTKELYKAFLQASSVRYSGLALSDVSPDELSHDAISRWLKSKHFAPSEVWALASKEIDVQANGFLIADDTVLTKQHSKRCEPWRAEREGE